MVLYEPQTYASLNFDSPNLTFLNPLTFITKPKSRLGNLRLRTSVESANFIAISFPKALPLT